MGLNSQLPMYLFLSVASVAVFSFIAVSVWSQERRREREAFYRSETIKRIAETQGPGSSAAIDFLREEEKNTAQRRYEGRKLGGLVTSAVGLALMIFIRGVNRNDPDPAWLVGLIPLFIGLSLLAYSYLFAPRR